MIRLNDEEKIIKISLNLGDRVPNLRIKISFSFHFQKL